MSEAKHSPGPWKLETVRTTVGVCHKIGSLGDSTKLRHACLYDDCYSAHPRDMQLLADARLIAKSPEMFALLQELIDIEGPQPGSAQWAQKVQKLIAEVEGK